MNLHSFVSASAVVLLGWLALSFQHRGTPSPYPSPEVTQFSPMPAPVAEESLVSSISPSP